MRPEPMLYIFDGDETLRTTTVRGQSAPRAPNEWALMPHVAEMLRTMPWDTIHLGVISNQDEISYGYLTETAAHALLMDSIVMATGHRPPDEAVRLCPHRLADGCPCHKPAPGMVVDICHYYGIPQHAAIYVGNRDIDEMTAARAGVRFAWAANFFGWAPSPLHA